MDSQNNSQSVTHSRDTNTYDDQLDKCEQVSQIKARIMQLERHQEQTRQRKARFLQNREERIKAGRDVSLSISNNASAIFSTAKSRKNQDEAIRRYQDIANLTQQQNNNLKQQNEYLLAKLKKMKEKEKKFIVIAQKAQKYKTLYEQSLKQLQFAKSQCQAYKKKAEQMKKIALLDVGKLQDKLIPFMKSLDESDTTNSQAVSRGQSKIIRQDVLATYSKET